MTRDEAIVAFHKITYPDSSWNTVGWERDRAWSGRAIDGFVALGILKLDEPPEVSLLKEIERFSVPGGCFEVSVENTSKLIDLVQRLGAALKSATAEMKCNSDHPQ